MDIDRDRESIDHEVVDSAEEEFIAVTTPKGLTRILETHPIKEWSERGVKVRIMAPINPENFKIAQKISEFCQIRHIDKVYVRLAMVDKKHFLYFKIPPLKEETTEHMTYFDNMFYTNDLEYVERISKMLDSMWRNSINISNISFPSKKDGICSARARLLRC